MSLTHSRLRFCSLANLLGALQALGYRLNSINSTRYTAIDTHAACTQAHTHSSASIRVDIIIVLMMLRAAVLNHTPFLNISTRSSLALSHTVSSTPHNFITHFCVIRRSIGSLARLLSLLLSSSLALLPYSVTHAFGL